MKVLETPLSGLFIIEPRLHKDERGYFYENFQQTRYEPYGISGFVQDNFSHSKQHTLRGLHYQHPKAQGKLVGVLRGKVFDVVLDIRVKSPTFGQWFSIILSDEHHQQLYVPAGFAHGFCVISESADFYYKCTDFYSPQDEKGIAWHDPTLNINWPTTKPLVSPKDDIHPFLADIPHDQLFI